MVRLAALLGFLAVALGAFAAHGLKDSLEPKALEAFQTGVRYQMYHALAILVLALQDRRLDRPIWRRVQLCFTAGILLFSGSLYTMALTGSTLVAWITPLGGLLFLVGWLLLAFQKTSGASD